MTDIYNFFKTMESDDIILSYRGDITPELLATIYGMIESKLEKEPIDARRKKKFYHVLVECLQNVYHHMETLQNENQNENEGNNGKVIFMIGRGEQNSYRVITGNFILNSSSEALKTKIDKINNMNADELQSYYLDSLNTTQLSEKGGAGLGLIDIARKAGHKLNYHFHKVSDKFSFFSLCVTMK